LLFEKSVENRFNQAGLSRMEILTRDTLAATEAATEDLFRTGQAPWFVIFCRAQSR